MTRHRRRAVLGGGFLAAAAVGAWIRAFRPGIRLSDAEASPMVSAMVPAYFFGLAITLWGGFATPWNARTRTPTIAALSYTRDVVSSGLAMVPTVIAWLLLENGLAPFRGGSTAGRLQAAGFGCAILTVTALVWAWQPLGPRPLRSIAVRTASWFAFYAFACAWMLLLPLESSP